MRDVLPTLQAWIEEGRRFALATVVRTWGSSPRPAGSVMGVREDGLVCGSVSGGCVESAVVEAALAALETGSGKALSFGRISDEDALAVGLSCGGELEVWVEPNPHLQAPETWLDVICHLSAGEPCVWARTLVPPTSIALTTNGPPSESSCDEAADALSARESRLVETEGVQAFLHVFPRQEKLIVVGAGHLAIPLVRFAEALGFQTVVVDPRSALANPERFPEPPDRFIADWPDKALPQVGVHEETYAALLTHDPKIDDQALEILLRSPARYIGALGSKSTHAKRLERLASRGFTESELARIQGPIGLPLGARTAEEIALSIAAQIVQVRREAR